MIAPDEDEHSALARSAAARARLALTLGELQARLSPKALARDAVQELKETGQELARDGVAAAKRHPLTIGGAAAGIIVFLLRRPLGKLIRSAGDATAATGERASRARHRRLARSRVGPYPA